VKTDDVWVPNRQAKPVLAMLVDIVREGTKFWASQSEPAAASSAKSEM
jgi:hypothetical protein